MPVDSATWGGETTIFSEGLVQTQDGDSMMPRLILAVLIALQLTLDVSAAERTWTDVQGRSMRAELIRELDGDVTLLRAGKLITIPLHTLSEKDRQYISDVAAGKPTAEEPAEASAPPSVPAPAPTSPD